MKKSQADRLAKYGTEGVAFLTVMRPKLTEDGVTSIIARAMCNYLYRGMLAREWVLKPLVAIEALKKQCVKPGKYEFRRTRQREPFGPDNCVVVHITE